jgi:hypothetical protein
MSYRSLSGATLRLGAAAGISKSPSLKTKCGALYVAAQ